MPNAQEVVEKLLQQGYEVAVTGDGVATLLRTSVARLTSASDLGTSPLSTFPFLAYHTAPHTSTSLSRKTLSTADYLNSVRRRRRFESGGS